MPADEFSLIQRYFTNIGKASPNRVLGVGDDAAVVEVPTGKQLVVCMDTLIGGIHFPEHTSAADIAWKALVVNLSDLAAMAAEPDWFQLSLTVPEADEIWINDFAASLHGAATAFKIELIGGDTCRGPLSVSVQAAGLVAKDQYLQRQTCRPGDLIVVSGTLGDAALGLDVIRERVAIDAATDEHCRNKLNRPQPRLELQSFLRQHATAAIDISDGLVADLQHILQKSGVGAVIVESDIPVLPWIREHQRLDYALYGGDDYEICCTVAPAVRDEIQNWNETSQDCPLTIIGEIVDSGFQLSDGVKLSDLTPDRGYRHFG